MLTLQELRRMVDKAEIAWRVPTVRSLMDSGVPVVVKEVIDSGTDIAVYANGLVLYRAGSHATVFPIPPCRKYCYEMGNRCGSVQEIQAEFFERENWYIRLVLEGEDRLAINQEVRMGRNHISYSQVAEDWNVMVAEDRELERVLDREEICQLFHLITENQRYVMIRHYLQDMEQKEIARELGVSRQAVCDMIQKAMRRIRKECGIERGSGKK